MFFVKLSAAFTALCLLTAAAPKQTTGITDPQIANTAYTAGTIDTQTAQLALQKSKNKEVRAYASDVIRDHKAINNKITALLRKLRAKPETSELSKSLLAEATAERATLMKLKGADFDLAYAENEANFHRTVNSTVATNLIPSATNAELRNLLSDGLKICQTHEQNAQQLSQNVNAQRARL